METLLEFKVTLTPVQYHHTTGLRTREWLDYWFTQFGIGKERIPAAEAALHHNVIDKIKKNAAPLSGVKEIIAFFKARNFHIGLATSSPLSLVQVVVKKLDLEEAFEAVASAEHLPYGKPHPQVYMDCAESLDANPLHCLTFEDSFNGLIAAKAARMKCVVVPVQDQAHLPKWGAADLKLGSLLDFSEENLKQLTK